jgi:two-component system, chemotaxis family, chemotaxis protein CheY
MTRFSVLIVDDLPAMRESLSAAFLAAGCQVAAVGNGLAALQRVRAYAFDLVLTDLWMPGMDGLALIKAIRTERPQLRVIAMTGGGPRLPTEVAAQIADVWGAEAVLLKPFDEDVLVADVLGR